MAQFSLPQSGLVGAGDGVDCGAYTGNEWAAVLIAANRSGGMIVTGAAAPPGLPATQTVPNIGVYYAYADQLAVTSPGASQISIAVGAGIVDGRVYRNDTAITATAITNPAANPRIDRVVIRQNYTLANYTSVNAAALVVDFNTARICIISGAEAVGPVAPTLTQDEDRATYWDIPLAQYQISVAGVITGLTDEREWVDAEMKSCIVPVTNAWNTTDSASNTCDVDSYFVLLDNKSVKARGIFLVPNDFISSLTATAIVLPFATANIYANNQADYAACGEDSGTHSAVFGIAAIAVTDGFNSCICEISLASAAVGDIVRLQFTRNAVNALDTLNSDAYVAGWIVEYLGWGRR